MPVMPPRLTGARFFTEWQLHPTSAVVAGLMLAGYLAAVVVVRRRGGSWRPARTAWWWVGIALLVLSTQGSLAVYSDPLFTMHMVQHLALIMIVPLALLWARPLDLAVELGGPRVAGWLRSGPVAVLTHPLVALGLYAAAIAGTHLTDFMDAMMRHPWLHGLESAVYVVAGLLFFAPLVTDSPLRWQLSSPMRMMVLVLAMPVDTFTGVILGQDTSYPWPAMAAMHPMWASSLLDDLHAGGAVMWIGGDAVMAVLMGVAAATWARIAGTGETSELGGWLSAARVNYQQARFGEPASAAAEVVLPRTGDSDEDLADYNAYLARLNRVDGTG